MRILFRSKSLCFFLIALVIFNLSSFLALPKNVQAADAHFIDAQAGMYHSLALSSDGTVWSWGSNNWGQLGINSKDYTTTPIKVPELTDIKAIAAGETYSVALKNDGSVWVWGKSNETGMSIPVSKIDGMSGITQISAGYSFVMALKADGTVWSWGDGFNGVLGDGTQANHNTAIQVQGLSGVKLISAAGYHTLALKDDGTVWSWGYNNYGQIGDGTNTTRLLPVQVKGLTQITDLAAGDTDGLALKANGSLMVWGDNSRGQIENSGQVDTRTPFPITNISDVADIASGGGQHFAVKTDGTLWAWGTGDVGQLGTNDRTTMVTPVQVKNISKVQLIRAGTNHSFAFDEEGNLWAWGSNSYGKLGDCTFVDQLQPEKLNNVPVENSSLAQIGGESPVAAGGKHTLVLHSDGTVWSWGDNTQGQLGIGIAPPNFSVNPIRVKDLTNVIAIAAGAMHNLALKQDGTAWSWGNNDSGQLGNGITNDSAVPKQIPNLSNIVGISAGIDFSLALKRDGTVWAWGNNEFGELGSGSTVNSSVPIQVKGLTNITRISAGSASSLALKNDGTVWTWGGQNVGDAPDTFGSVTDVKTTPVQVSGLGNAVALATGFSHSLALLNDGTVWAWGSNHGFQLGNNNHSFQKNPVQVEELKGIISISAGTFLSMGLKRDGTVWSWGANYLGQLGNGVDPNTQPFAINPVQVKSLQDVTAIASGTTFNIVRKRGGEVWTWGANDGGQLGDGFIGGPIGNTHTASDEVTGENVPVKSLINIGSGYDTQFKRLAGTSAEQTAIEISKEGWPNGADAVVLATVNNFPDALASAPLAHQYDAPILLTQSKEIAPEILQEIHRLNPKQIIIVGGTSVVASGIETVLKQDYLVARIAGWDKYETASLVAQHLNSINPAISGKAVIANGDNFPDALSISSWAAYNGIPILLTPRDELPDFTKQALQKLNVTDTIVVGGTAVVGNQVFNELPRALRYSGLDQYQTGIAIAKSLGSSANKIYVATGSQFADALAGSASAARTGSAIILVDRGIASTAVANYLSNNGGRIKETIIIGGTAVVPTSDYNELTKLIP